ncbi:MAG: hypothetical protein U0U67_04575 [Chitinophagales bacterium]
MPNCLDIGLSDEADYMKNGLLPLAEITPNWGPFYGLWYRFLNIFSATPIDLYYLNYTALALWIALPLFILLIRMNVPLFAALFIAICYLVNPITILLVPKVCHFIIGCMLIAIVITTYIKATEQKLMVLTLVIYLCSYARLEAYLAFVIFAIWLCVYIIIKRKSISKKSYVLFAALKISIILCHFAFSFPDDNIKGYDRSYVAFTQHYVGYEVLVKKKLKVNGLQTMLLKYTEEIFKDCRNMKDVITKYPMKVLEYVFFNVKQLLVLIPYGSLTLLAPFASMKRTKIGLALTVLFFIALFFFVLRKKENRVEIKQFIKEHQFIYYVLCVIALPSLISCVLIAPRLHYLYIAILPVVFLLVAVFSVIKIQDKFVYVLFVLSAVLLPSIKNYSLMAYSVTGKSNDGANKLLVQFLNDKFQQEPKNILTFVNGVVAYLNQKNQEFNTYDLQISKQKTDDFIKQKNIDLIVMPTRMNEMEEFKNDTAWHQFYDNYGNYGFAYYKMKDKKLNVEVDVLVKN